MLAAGIVVAASDVRAEPNEGGAAAAESLFQEARKLMDAKRYGEACPKLVASHKLAPAVGTLLNLADCYERGGQPKGVAATPAEKHAWDGHSNGFPGTFHQGGRVEGCCG